MQTCNLSTSLLNRRSIVQAAMGAAVVSLAGCGFTLRGAQSYAFGSLYINGSDKSLLLIELRRALQSSGDLRVITDTRQLAEAQVVLDVISDQREKTVVGVTSSGQVRELQLRQRFTFRLRNKEGKELIPDTELLLRREISFNESAVLSKEAEEGVLYRNMQSDIVQQVQRRLGAVR
jgi:LPS-assembly lipoprotein